jgi:hypothetical protein
MDTVLALDPHVLDDPLSHFRESRVCLTADQLDLLNRYFEPFLETGSRHGALDV